jgi:hypothetical protein
LQEHGKAACGEPSAVGLTQQGENGVR